MKGASGSHLIQGMSSILHLLDTAEAVISTEHVVPDIKVGVAMITSCRLCDGI